jgi:hypothetical protein
MDVQKDMKEAVVVLPSFWLEGFINVFIDAISLLSAISPFTPFSMGCCVT